MGRVQILTAIMLLLAACSGSVDTDTSDGGSPGPDAMAPDSEDVNLDVWLERLEVGSRELYSARDAVVAALALKEGDVVADIGAGTGLYSLLFAEAVGENGHVYAVDIEPLFLDLINRRAEDIGLENVTAVLGRRNNIALPKNSIDVVFIADTYHYFDDREEIMRSVKDALKPGGALVVVDFEITSETVRPEDKSHVRFGKAGVISEMEFVGFETVDDVAVDGLAENYFVRFLNP